MNYDAKPYSIKRIAALCLVLLVGFWSGCASNKGPARIPHSIRVSPSI